MTRETITATANRLQAELELTKSKFESFKTQVRDEAIRVKEDMGWCEEGLNETLENLGLPGIEREFEAVLRVVVKRQATSADAIVDGDLENDVKLYLSQAGLEVAECFVEDVSET